MRIMAIDPGPTYSAYVIVGEDLRPRVFEKIENYKLLRYLDTPFDQLVIKMIGHHSDAPPADKDVFDQLVIEMIGHYGTGMPAGKDVFDTCVWIGRFWQAYDGPAEVPLIKRATVKAHICGSAKATDGNVIQALIDRFAPGVRNHGKGVKSEPGWFYGFYSDVWQAYALAVYYMDKQKEVAA